ncbi:hypothetical protein N0B31_19415 [Salinirubellus salinus]|uniref:DUF2795 domain-containing protein n=1 Tax=Salinirubellus salinus TaxID=1364945 RepID=A0A9E7UAP7_9EURY|nr:hypothetical protein [Salinirubellus salinus]UWM54272.1 hypothetical protein N0B31_19415 [Salinirubellus salinus]
MERRLTLDRCRQVFDLLSYPITREDAGRVLGHVTLQYADGEEPFPAAVERTPSDRFESADDLELELFMSLPIAAVGEPGQSEGDA